MLLLKSKYLLRFEILPELYEHRSRDDILNHKAVIRFSWPECVKCTRITSGLHFVFAFIFIFFRKWDVGVWTGSSWLRRGTGGGHLWIR